MQSLDTLWQEWRDEAFKFQSILLATPYGVHFGNTTIEGKSVQHLAVYDTNLITYHDAPNPPSVQGGDAYILFLPKTMSDPQGTNHFHPPSVSVTEASTTVNSAPPTTVAPEATVLSAMVDTAVPSPLPQDNRRVLRPRNPPHHKTNPYYNKAHHKRTTHKARKSALQTQSVLDWELLNEKMKSNSVPGVYDSLPYKEDVSEYIIQLEEKDSSSEESDQSLKIKIKKPLLPNPPVHPVIDTLSSGDSFTTAEEAEDLFLPVPFSEIEQNIPSSPQYDGLAHLAQVAAMVAKKEESLTHGTPLPPGLPLPITSSLTQSSGVSSLKDLELKPQHDMSVPVSYDSSPMKSNSVPAPESHDSSPMESCSVPVPSEDDPMESVIEYSPVVKEERIDSSFLAESVPIQQNSVPTSDSWEEAVDTVLEMHDSLPSKESPIKFYQEILRNSLRPTIGRCPSMKPISYPRKPLQKPDFESLNSVLAEVMEPLRTEQLPILYERITQKPDMWNYVDHKSFEVLAHIPEQTPPRSPNQDAPVGHPIWCALRGIPLVRSQLSIDFDETMGKDYHPLPAYHIPVFEHSGCRPPEEFDPLVWPFIEARLLINNTIVTPQDWEKYPVNKCTSYIRRQLAEEYESWQLNKHSREYIPGAGYPPPGFLHNKHTEVDHPANWTCQDLGPAETDEFFTKCYSSPFENDKDHLAYNFWNPKIVVLRQARFYIEEGLRHFARFLLSPYIRQLVDTYPDTSATKHYFYHHCHIFRYIKISDPNSLHTQGFPCSCIHYDKTQSRHSWNERKPHPPVNPLLTVEEDEFLHHAAEVFVSLDLLDVTNVLRRFRRTVPYLPDHAWILFEAGYLTSYHNYDAKGKQYALLWESPNPSL
jgi:hypothetical protein